MGFLDLFKKKKKQEPIEISKENLNEWISKEKNKSQEKQKDFIKEVEERTNILLKNLEQGFKELKTVDLEQERAEQRIKLIRNQNLEEFTRKTEKLISELNTLNKQNIIQEINSKLTNFKKRTHLNFQKATLLVSKEPSKKIENIPKTLDNFTKDLEKIIKQNKEIIDKSNIINSIKEKTENLTEINNKISSLKNELKEFDNKISDLNKSLKNQNKKINDLKNSEEYKKEIKKRQELENKKQKLQNQIYNLKQTIDFKTLTQFFHSFKKEMKKIKSFKEDFKETFLQNQQTLIKLLKESKLLNNKIQEKIQNINQLNENINSIKLNPTGIQKEKDKIKNIKLEINSMNNEKQKHNKRLKKLSLHKKELLDSIKKELNKINVRIKNQ